MDYKLGRGLINLGKYTTGIASLYGGARTYRNELDKKKTQDTLED